MLRNGSPTGANVYDTEWNGRPARIVDRDVRRHLPAAEGNGWDTYPERGNGWLVLEYAPTGTPAAPPAAAPVAEVEPEPAAPAPAPRVEAVTTPRPEPAPKAKAAAKPEAEGNVWPKTLYAEALADGRPDLSDVEYRLLMAMWRYAHNFTLENVRPGHALLAEQVGLSGKSGRDKVRTRINSLIRKGYVVKVREGRSIPTKVAAEYRLTLPEWEEDGR